LIADRWSRVKSIFLMATVWSLATIACAFTRNYGQLFAGRAAIGLGEAGYGSAAGALLASIFPGRLRSTHPRAPRCCSSSRPAATRPTNSGWQTFT